MYLSYNGFNHPAGQVNVQWHFDAIENEGGQVIAYNARADIIGKLISREATVDACQADLTAQVKAIQDAYVDGGDLILILDNGQQSAHSILDANALGGVKVVRAPSFPGGSLPQYPTQLDFAIAIEAELPNFEESNDLWSFEESLTFEGTGGPEIDVVECVQGPPVAQTLKERTAMTAIQEGRAIGYLGYWTPMYAPPIWPSLEQVHLRIQRPGSPKRKGSGNNTGYKMFPTSWRYTFKSADPISTLTPPHFWPV